MQYKLKKETKPTLSTFGKYKVVASHHQTIETEQLIRELARMGHDEGAVTAILTDLGNAVSSHLRNGDKVRLEKWGLLKLEIESEKVDSPEQFNPRKHIRGVRLHFLPECKKGKPELYSGIRFREEKQLT